MGFTLARFMYLDIPGVFCSPGGAGSNHAAPGECYYYENFTLQKIGIRLHLYCILRMFLRNPLIIDAFLTTHLAAGFLAVFQFVPAIRHKVMLLHRMNGYIIILLVSVGNAGALMIARNAFGGTLSTQLYVGFAVGATTIGIALAYYNVKRLQIDQHRAWMLRVWFYFSTIITLRIISIIAAYIVTAIGTYNFAQPCVKMSTIFASREALERLYPLCSNLNNYTVVRANMNGNAAEVATALNIVFGMSAWGAFVLHAFGVEVYLHLTPKESQRLRDVSYQRQMEAGMKHPGNAGLTPQRLGDAHLYVPVDDKFGEAEKRPLTDRSPDPSEHFVNTTTNKAVGPGLGLNAGHALYRTPGANNSSNAGY